MNWPQVFLGCFVIGFVLSALSFAVGIVDAHVHFPWEHHVHAGAWHVGNGPGPAVGPINFATLTAFLAWFGGTGYLLTSQFRWLALPAVGLSVVLGLCGAAAVFWIMARVLWSPLYNNSNSPLVVASSDGSATRFEKEASAN